MSDLTDEQIEDMRGKFLAIVAVATAVPERGGTQNAAERFEQWLTAVEARAKRQERERVAGLLRTRGYADAYRVVKELEATDDRRS